jgi:hypothetical protein
MSECLLEMHFSTTRTLRTSLKMQAVAPAGAPFFLTAPYACAQFLAMLALSSEFENIAVREEEMPELDALSRSVCPHDIKGGAENKHGKVNVLLQARALDISFPPSLPCTAALSAPAAPLRLEGFVSRRACSSLTPLWGHAASWLSPPFFTFSSASLSCSSPASFSP